MSYTPRHGVDTWSRIERRTVDQRRAMRVIDSVAEQTPALREQTDLDRLRLWILLGRHAAAAVVS